MRDFLILFYKKVPTHWGKNYRGSKSNKKNIFRESNELQHALFTGYGRTG